MKIIIITCIVIAFIFGFWAGANYTDTGLITYRPHAKCEHDAAIGTSEGAILIESVQPKADKVKLSIRGRDYEYQLLE